MKGTQNRFYLKALDAFDLEKRFLESVRYLKTSPLHKLWILIPQYAHHTHWKKQLTQHQIPTIQIEFLTPSQLRARLASLLQLDLPLPLNREAMKFILEKTAEPFAESTPLFRPLSRDAQPLLRTLDEVENSGMSIHDLQEIEELLPWLKAWKSISLESWGRANQDALILKTAREIQSPFPESCIWLGLDRNALAYSPLLEASLALFGSLVVLHQVPEVAEESTQQPWLNQVDLWLPNASESLPTENELILDPPTTPNASFFVTPSLHQEIEKITQITLHALAQNSHDSSIGIILPALSPIAHELLYRFEQHQIPFFSSWNNSLPMKPGDRAILSLIHLQQEPTLESPRWIDFLEAHRDFPEIWNHLQITPDQLPTLRDQLYRSFQKTLSSHLQEALPQSVVQRFIEFYQKELLYPEFLSIEKGLALSVHQVHRLLGKEYSEPFKIYLEKSLLDLTHVWKKPLSKNDYLKLLQRTLETQESLPSGDPWAQVWILSPEEATARTWDTLIFGQLNDLFWNTISHTGISLLSDDLRMALNQRLQGSPSFQPFLTLAEQYQIQRARFETLLGSTRNNLFFTASASHNLQSGDELYPSEFYRQAWNRFYADTPWQETFWNELLNQNTQSSPPFSPPQSFESLKKIQADRLNPQKPFDEYFFCDTASSALSRPLSATHAERILKDPASAWFEIYLDTKPIIDSWKTRDLLPLLEGNRLHEWIAQSFREITSQDQEFSPLPPLNEWSQSLKRLLGRIENDPSKNNSAPLWWKNHFLSLRWKALRILENLHEKLSQLPDAHVACEYQPHRKMIQPLPEFPLDQEWRGRIDWIALNDKQWERCKKIWVLDLKTGTTSDPFHRSDLISTGNYFQLLVYAGLLQAQHAAHPEISVGVILPRWEPATLPESISAFDPEFQTLWKRLSQAWNQGRFGQSQAIHQRFSQGRDLPIATTPITQDILDQKMTLESLKP